MKKKSATPSETPSTAKLAVPSRGTQTLANLEQIRILANPLRLRILGALVLQPRTTKQVADLLGEKHTKLYHHVQALERAKVIRLTETRPKRGTIEKYYQATAAMFQAASSAFGDQPRAGAKQSGLEAMLEALLDSARRDVLAHLRSDTARESGGNKGILAVRFLIRGQRQKVLRAVQRRISLSLRQLSAEQSEHSRHPRKSKKDGDRTYSLTIIACPTKGT
jgi:DNA-binding transcriptional ArsR family regulator